MHMLPKNHTGTHHINRLAVFKSPLGAGHDIVRCEASTGMQHDAMRNVSTRHSDLVQQRLHD